MVDGDSVSFVRPGVVCRDGRLFRGLVSSCRDGRKRSLSGLVAGEWRARDEEEREVGGLCKLARGE